MRPIAAWALLPLAACFYSVDPNIGFFSCATNTDCGSGWHCNTSCAVPGFNPYCVENQYCDPCPDMNSDPQNCGGCGIVCGTGQICINGVCIQPTPQDAG